MTKNKQLFYGWWVVAVGFGVWFIMAINPFSIILKLLIAEFNTGRGEVSILSALAGIGGGLGAFIVSFFIKRYSPRKFMLCGAAAGVVIYLLCAAANSLWQLYMLYFLLGFIFNGACGAISYLEIISRWFNRKRGLAVGIAFSGMSFGSLIVFPIIGIISSNFGWRLTHVFCAAMVLLIDIPLILWLLKDSPEKINLLPDGDTPETVNKPVSRAIKTIEPETTSPSLLAYLKRHAAIPIIISFPVIAMGCMAIMQHLVSFLTDIGITPTVAASALGFTAGIGTISGLFSGWLCDRIPRKHVMTIFTALTLISIYLLIKTDSVSTFWFFVVIFGLGAAGALGTVFPLVIGDIFGAKGFIRVFGLANFLFAIGFALGPPLAGYLFDATGSYTIVFIIAAALNILGIVAIYIAYALEKRQFAKNGLLSTVNYNL